MFFFTKHIKKSLPIIGSIFLLGISLTPAQAHHHWGPGGAYPPPPAYYHHGNGFGSNLARGLGLGAGIGLGYGIVHSAFNTAHPYYSSSYVPVAPPVPVTTTNVIVVPQQVPAPPPPPPAYAYPPPGYAPNYPQGGNYSSTSTTYSQSYTYTP